jgi:phospholipid/cholesterol/gamma-HCH transport system substrate-binding protein
VNFKFKYTDKIVGFFVVLSFLILLGVSFLIIYNQRLFTKKYTFHTSFEDANGIKPNKDILFKGFKIGKIKNFELNRFNWIDVEFFIYETYIDRIRENSVLNKSANPLTGSQIVFIPNMTSDQLAREGSIIPSLDMKEGELLLARGEVEKQADQISNIINSVNDLLKSINDDDNPDANSISRILVNTADSVEQLNRQLQTVDAILGNVELFSEDLREPEGLVQRLIDPDGDIMFNSLQKSLASLADAMEDLSELTTFLRGQENQIESLLIESTTTLDQAQEVIEGIRNNPLVKSGITEKKDQDLVKESIRDRDF